MADPLLEGKYPMKGLYQALAVAAMCLQEEAATRPLISDVVTAMEFLATKNLQADDEDDEERVFDSSSAPEDDVEYRNGAYESDTAVCDHKREL